MLLLVVPVCYSMTTAQPDLRTELWKAIEAEQPAQKNFHVRQALQLLELADAPTARADD